MVTAYAFGVVSRGKAGIDQKTRPVLHQRVSEKAEPRFHTVSLAVEPGLGIGRARMCGVGPPLAAKVRLEIAAGTLGTSK